MFFTLEERGRRGGWADKLLLSAVAGLCSASLLLPMTESSCPRPPAPPPEAVPVSRDGSDLHTALKCPRLGGLLI